MPPHRTVAELEAGLTTVLEAPAEAGIVRLVVRRPDHDQREILDEGELDLELGLVGDSWIKWAGMGSDRPAAHAQVTIMNARYTELIAGPEPEDWARAGDQLYLDLDISQANLPPGTRLAVGDAVLEIQAEPHTGCAAFSARFGSEALRFANSERGRQLRLRGANTVVITPGSVRPGDEARKL
jgi:hypothetical protein